MIHINEKENSTCVLCKSFTELANIQVSPVNKEKWDDILANDHRQNDMTWFGIRGGRSRVREVCELYGWNEGRQKGFDAIKDMEIPKLPHFRRQRTRTSQGHALDIHSVYGGNLDRAWEGFKKTKHTISYRGHATIVVNIGANCGTSAQDMFWRGATAAIICKGLLKSGRNVRILVSDTTTGFTGYSVDRSVKGTKRLNTIVIVKDYSFPINYDSLFASTALAGFLRHYFFKAILSMPYEINSGLGSAVSVNENDFEPFTDSSPTIFIENIWSESQAINRIETFKKSIESDILESRN